MTTKELFVLILGRFFDNLPSDEGYWLGYAQATLSFMPWAQKDVFRQWLSTHPEMLIVYKANAAQAVLKFHESRQVDILL